MRLDQLLPDFQIRQQFVAMPNSTQQLIGPDSSRWALLFGNPSGSDYIIGASSGILTTQGIALPSKQNFVLYWTQHPAMISQAWFGVTMGLGVNIYIVETLYRPQGREPTQEDMTRLSREYQ
jgi:hypothetical protein